MYINKPLWYKRNIKRTAVLMKGSLLENSGKTCCSMNCSTLFFNSGWRKMKGLRATVILRAPYLWRGGEFLWFIIIDNRSLRWRDTKRKAHDCNTVLMKPTMGKKAALVLLLTRLTMRTFPTILILTLLQVVTVQTLTPVETQLLKLEIQHQMLQSVTQQTWIRQLFLVDVILAV